MQGQGERTLNFKDAQVSSQGRRPREGLRRAGGCGQRRGGLGRRWVWPSQERVSGAVGGLAAPSSPSCSTPCPSPHRASCESGPARACHLPTPSCAWSRILLFPERAAGDGGICLLSPAFLWAPDSQELGLLPPPTGTPPPQPRPGYRTGLG